jgi:hypothetical protein
VVDAHTHAYGDRHPYRHADAHCHSDQHPD